MQSIFSESLKALVRHSSVGGAKMRKAFLWAPLGTLFASLLEMGPGAESDTLPKTTVWRMFCSELVLVEGPG